MTECKPLFASMFVYRAGYTQD